jgi:hypothetical protein
MKVPFFIATFLCLIKAYASITYGQFSSLTTQIPNGPSLIKVEVTDEIKNLSISNGKDKLIIKEDGVYFVLVTAQVGAIKELTKGYLDLWFVKNDVALSNTNCRLSIKEWTDTAVLMTQVSEKFQAGDTLSVRFSSSSPELGIICIKPENEPIIPSVILSIFKLETF